MPPREGISSGDVMLPSSGGIIAGGDCPSGIGCAAGGGAGGALKNGVGVLDVARAIAADSDDDVWFPAMVIVPAIFEDVRDVYGYVPG